MHRGRLRERLRETRTRRGVGLPAARAVPLSGVETVNLSQGSLRALLEASRSLGSELSLEPVLQRLVATAAELTGARYAAIGVIDAGGRELERFVTWGIDEETYRAIGPLPRGHGILGVLIREATALRLHDLGEDPRSVGFPPNHPPMHSFLGVPIILRGVAYGNFYLTEKEGGHDFTDEDEEIVALLADQAAAAVERARLYDAQAHWSRQLESLNEIGNAIAMETDLGRLLDIVARRLLEIVGARLVAVMLPAGSSELRVAAIAGDLDGEFVGQLVPMASKTGRVFQRGHSERVDSVYDDPEVNPEVVRGFKARTGLWVPLVARGEPIGVIAVHDKLDRDPRFTDGDLRMAETFATRAAVAVSLSQRIARDTLRRIVEAQELERRRLARELHDETGQALSSILLGLKALEDKLDADEARAALRNVRELAVATLQDVRQLAVDLRPKVLDDFGLVPALERLTESFGAQTGIVTRFEEGLGPERLPAEIETTLYRIVQEALTNIVKHSQAQSVSVVALRKTGAASVVIEDDGAGFDPARIRAEAIGLVGMRERVQLLDGRLEIESAENSGTTVVAEVPLA